MRAWLRRFSTDRPRWGWRRAAKMARRAGWQVNNKRIRRLWREEGLRVPQRRKKKRLTGIGVAVGAMSPICPNVIWAMDFQFDTTADGRTLKMLNVIDEFTREALAIEVDRGIDADGVVDVLDRLVLQHGAPHYVRFDNGPEFVAHAVHDWCRFNSAWALMLGDLSSKYTRAVDNPPTNPMPQRAPSGPDQVLVGNVACLGHGGSGESPQRQLATPRTASPSPCRESVAVDPGAQSVRTSTDNKPRLPTSPTL